MNKQIGEYISEHDTKALRVNSIPKSEHIDNKQLENLREGLA